MKQVTDPQEEHNFPVAVEECSEMCCGVTYLIFTIITLIVGEDNQKEVQFERVKYSNQAQDWLNSTNIWLFLEHMELDIPLCKCGREN